MTRFRKWLIHKLGGSLIEDMPEVHFDTTHIDFKPISVVLPYNKDYERLMPKEEILQTLNNSAAYEIGNAIINEKLCNVQFDYDTAINSNIIKYEFLISSARLNCNIELLRY